MISEVVKPNKSLSAFSILTPDAILLLNSSDFSSEISKSDNINLPISCKSAGRIIYSFKSTSTFDNHMLAKVDEIFEALIKSSLFIP